MRLRMGVVNWLRCGLRLFELWTDKFVYKFGECIQYLLAFECLDFSEYISLIFFSPLPCHTIVLLIFLFCVLLFFLLLAFFFNAIFFLFFTLLLA